MRLVLVLASLACTSAFAPPPLGCGAPLLQGAFRPTQLRVPRVPRLPRTPPIRAVVDIDIAPGNASRSTLEELELPLPIELPPFEIPEFDLPPARATSKPTTLRDVDLVPRPPAYPPTPTTWSVLAFALPALGIYVASPLMSLIDAAIVGRASSLDLAALGPSSMVSDTSSWPLLFVSIAATNLVAKAHAKGDDDAAARTAVGATVLGALGGALLGGLCFAYATPLASLYCGAAPSAAQLVPLAASYIAIRAVALPAVVVATVAQAVCIGVKDSRTPVLAIAASAALNLVGDVVLVQHLHLGLAGAAWATSGSQFVGAAMLLRALRRKRYLSLGALTTRSGGAPDSTEDLSGTEGWIGTGKTPWSSGGATAAVAVARRASPLRAAAAVLGEVAVQVLGFVPFLFVMLIKMTMHNTAAATAAGLCGAQAAAHTALFAVAMLGMTIGDVASSLSQAYLPAFAIDAEDGAHATQVAQAARGARGASAAAPTFDLEAARPTIGKLVQATLLISAAVVAISSTIVLHCAGSLTCDAAVVAQMRRVWPLVVGSLAVHGTAVALEGLLVAKKDFRSLAAVSTAVGLSVVGLFSATRRFGLGLAGVWATYLFYMGSRALAFAWRGGLLGGRPAAAAAAAGP